MELVQAGPDSDIHILVRQHFITEKSLWHQWDYLEKAIQHEWEHRARPYKGTEILGAPPWPPRAPHILWQWLEQYGIVCSRHLTHTTPDSTNSCPCPRYEGYGINSFTLRKKIIPKCWLFWFLFTLIVLSI